jgi:hypothetical protein
MQKVRERERDETGRRKVGKMGIREVREIEK